jgi:hypothetical protein
MELRPHCLGFVIASEKMTKKQTHSALRHIGVALIDLDYAILELTQSPCQPCARDAHRANIRQLSDQRDRLREFADGLVTGLGGGDGQVSCWASKWWPDLASKTRADRAVGRSPSDGAAV